jgi:hypothetical protein
MPLYAMAGSQKKGGPKPAFLHFPMPKIRT